MSVKLDFSILDRIPQSEPVKTKARVKAPAPKLDFSIFERLDSKNMPVMQELTIDELNSFIFNYIAF